MNENTLMLTQFKTLIERFANSTSADDLFEAINNIYRDADRDPELKGWFRQVDSYVRRCLKEQGYILQDAATNEYNQLYDRGQFLLRDRYRDHTNRIIDETKFLADQFDQDPYNKRFANSMNKLFTDLGNDENGKPVFKKHLVKDLTEIIIPGAFESVRYVPVPRIEYSDPMIDAIVENLVIESDNLMPNALELGSDNFFRWGRKTEVSRQNHKVMLSVSGVQMDLKDVSYYIKKKQGFPSLTDKGVIDIFMGGTGFGFKVAMETANEKNRAHFFKINTVLVDVKNLQLKLKQSNHKLLFNIFKPLLLSVMKPVIVKVLEKVIKDNIQKGDAYAYEIYKEANRAAETAKNDPEQAQNIYQRYVTAAQEKMALGKKKADDTAANKQVNVATTTQDSIFKNIKLPGGISTKATEYKKLAADGERWESPVFGIGSARETADLPKPAPITRKPHNAASGGVRGPQNLEQREATALDQIETKTSGYGQTTTSNYPTSTGGVYDTTTNGSTGFSTQVNQAFDNNQDLSLTEKTPANGHSGGTFLGMNNPVLKGSA